MSTTTDRPALVVLDGVRLLAGLPVSEEDEPEPLGCLLSQRAKRAIRQAWGSVLKKIRVDVCPCVMGPALRAEFGISTADYFPIPDLGFITIDAQLAPNVRDAAIAREVVNIIRMRAEARATQTAKKAPCRRRLIPGTSRTAAARSRGLYALPAIATKDGAR